VTLEVSKLDKVFFPGDGYTKGDVMRYYARVAPFILPTLRDRPLVLRRFPNGITGQAFYQQKAPAHVPPGVRVEEVVEEDGERVPRFVGGDLATLLYLVQLGAISTDPWHSRVSALDAADYTILDLDPGPRAPFRRVVDVARWVKEELDRLSLSAALKTSGASGLHIVVPLPPGTPNEAARLLAQIVATRVADAHPREATVERSVRSRPPTTVYVDYLQNIRGKTVAGAYAVRARPGATVSTPLAWDELADDLDPRDFTIATVPERLAKVGDLWGAAMKKKNSLERVLEKE
jgi:bifunctional non-homologous end joining protein LigD